MRQAIDFSKDLLNGIWDKAGRQKDQLVSALSREFVKFLAQINVAEEMKKILDGLTLEVEAKIHFKKNADIKTQIRAKKSPKRKK